MDHRTIYNEAMVGALIFLVEDLYAQTFRKAGMTPEAATRYFDHMLSLWTDRVKKNPKARHLSDDTKATMIEAGAKVIAGVAYYVKFQEPANDED